MEHGAEAQNFPWTQVKDMNPCRDEGNFWAHAPYLGEAFDGGTEATQFAEAKLGSEGLGTGQEDAEAGTLEEYVTVLPFKLP
ncbi:hypothetical protein C4D60_Mb09t21980 [Musa balbisiana]|uniref:Uncharacterized protein n=1 Tax=Musa balbisiana TaxID=52838 RepID=A0A4S8II89_MUSBA|nr:hypothetical protein C4D60_Mb09t21980 [Musa balbisiana]